MADTTQKRTFVSNNKVFRIVESACLAVSVLGFGLMTTILEVYLRLLDHFYNLKQVSLVDLNCNTNNAPTDHRLIPIWLTDVLKHIFVFGQKCLTFWSLLSILLYTLPSINDNIGNPNWTCFAITLAVIIVPRTLFAIFIVAEQRDLLSSRLRTKNPQRRVNVSIRLVGVVYSGIMKTFKVLNGTERLFLLLSQYSQYVFLQLLGYSYNDHRIMLFSELESFGLIFYSSILRKSEIGGSVDVLIMLAIYFVRIILHKT